MSSRITTKLISPRKGSPVRYNRVQTASNIEARPGWNASSNGRSPQRQKTAAAVDESATRRPFVGYEMQSYRGQLKIDPEIKHLSEPERSNMQMMINQQVEVQVKKHMPSFAQHIHLHLQEERDKSLRKIEQYNRKIQTQSPDLYDQKVSRPKNTNFKNSPTKERQSPSRRLNQDLEDSVRDIKAPNLGQQQETSPRRNQQYMYPDGSQTAEKIKANPYNTMMYPHMYGHPAYGGHPGYGGHSGYGGYPGYGGGHPGYGGHLGFNGNHPQGYGGYGGYGGQPGYGMGHSWRGMQNNYQPWQFGQFGAYVNQNNVYEGAAVSYEIADQTVQRETSSPTRVSSKTNRKSNKGGQSPRKLIAGQTIQYINPNRYNSVFKPGFGSVPVDFIDEVNFHLDPISVALQERVKFGGHTTSEVKNTFKSGPFFYDLSELKQPSVKISKMAILSAEIEKEEKRGFKKRQRFISKKLVDKKQFQRNPQQAQLNMTISREEGELSRRENIVGQHQDKYYDPDAYEDPHRFFQRHMGLLREDGRNEIEPVAVDVNINTHNY